MVFGRKVILSHISVTLAFFAKPYDASEGTVDVDSCTQNPRTVDATRDCTTLGFFPQQGNALSGVAGRTAL